ncbi:MAG: glycerol-3-phosphate 1-O-acyltransferase PlsY, partial [Chloroflexi bacterium]|nr:glycerol-3-phosphate 1-O-acyltransferase PlsY [Chloroflexota bacterium]
PMGYLVCRARGVDPRAQGSGKTGATNVLRTLGPSASATVLVGDAAKGAAVVLFARFVLHGDVEAEVAAGIAAILGHVFPVFIGFRGGRGVATALGAMLIISPVIALAALVAGLLVIARSRVASLGSLLGVGIALLVTVALVLTRFETILPLVYCALACVIIVLTHRDNIQRLAAGTERKIQL